jgi:DNA-binding XRE family transcriptional regulator
MDIKAALKGAKDSEEIFPGPMTFATVMIASRTYKDMTQTQMAKLLGISKSTLCDIEKGRQLVSVELAAKTARKCKMPVVVAVQAALNDQLRRAGLKFTVRAS